MPSPVGRGRSGERPGGPRSSSAGSGERRERGPRPPRDANAAPKPDIAAAAATAIPNAAEGERGPRKPRRRRGGKRIDGGEGANPVNQAVRALETPAPVAVGAASTKSGGDAKPSLFSRIGRTLKSLVIKPPRSQH